MLFTSLKFIIFGFDTIRLITCFSYVLMISLEQNGWLLNKMAILFWRISLDSTKASEVRIAGDQSNS